MKKLRYDNHTYIHTQTYTNTHTHTHTLSRAHVPESGDGDDGEMRRPMLATCASSSFEYLGAPLERVVSKHIAVFILTLISSRGRGRKSRLTIRVSHDTPLPSKSRNRNKDK